MRKKTKIIGEKLKRVWQGPYEVIDIDLQVKRAVLADVKNRSVLKTKIPLDQLIPVKTSNLHPSASGDVLLHTSPVAQSDVTTPESQIARQETIEISSSEDDEPPSKKLKNYAYLTNNTYWLDDEDIDKGQYLLKSKCDGVSGLQSVLFLKQYEKHMDKFNFPLFIQIILVHNNHWITASNCWSPNKHEVVIYDSLISNYSHIELQTLCDIFSYLWTYEDQDQLTLLFADVQQQTGGSDCGLFSLAFAKTLCDTEDPREILYNQEEMRNNLKASFEDNQLIEFPSLNKNRCHGHYLNQVTITLHCVCRRPILQTHDMIACKFCSSKFHPKCVSYFDSSAGKLEIALTFLSSRGIHWLFLREIYLPFIYLAGTYYVLLLRFLCHSRSKIHKS